MNSARRPRPRSRQPPFLRVLDASQEYTTPSGDHNTAAHHGHQAHPLRSHETPAGFFVDKSRFWVADSQSTPPLAARKATSVAADDSSVGRGGDRGEAAALAVPAAAKSKRVRTGCLTCRERHLKCDEGAPDFQILDESRSIASNYEGGLELYPRVVTKTPPESELDAPSRHAAPGEDEFTFPPLRDPGGIGGYRIHSPNHNHGDPHGLNTTPQIPSQSIWPAPHSLRTGARGEQGRHSGTQTGLMTPRSEDTTDELEYLRTDEEIHFMQAYIDEVAIWMDALDNDKHFANVVPYLALKLPMLLNALLACGAKHLALIGQHDGDKADYYYNMASAQLSRCQQERDRGPADCVLTAVALDAYHLMSDPPAQHMDRIASTRALIRACGWDATSTGLAAACFWANVGMEVLGCIAFGWRTAWDPDQWGVDLSFATLESASRSGGGRSVAESDGVPWPARPQVERHPVADDSADTGQEALWVQRIFCIMAKVSNFRANAPQFQEPLPHNEQDRLQHRFAEWRRLQNMCNAWNLGCPRSMRPYGYSPGPTPRSLFPNVWLIKSSAKLARLFYHTAMCLLAQANPLDPRDSREKRALQLHHAHRACGIVAHTRDRGLVSVAVRTLAVAAAALVDCRERDEVVTVLDRIQRETGWRLEKVVQNLRSTWGWDAAGPFPSSSGPGTTAAAGAAGSRRMDLLAPLHSGVGSSRSSGR
ncbi:hypothetical protein VTH06DRAFT_2499 [Thermothelomyces fergusii]